MYVCTCVCVNTQIEIRICSYILKCNKRISILLSILLLIQLESKIRSVKICDRDEDALQFSFLVIYEEATFYSICEYIDFSTYTLPVCAFHNFRAAIVEKSDTRIESVENALISEGSSPVVARVRCHPKDGRAGRVRGGTAVRVSPFEK